MTKQSNGNVVHSVKSNQEDIYKNLEEVVRKYATTSFLRPVASRTSQPSGRARFAGQLKASIRTMTSKMGSDAINAVMGSPPIF